MRFSAELLWAVLEDTLPPGTTGLLAALSGGLDSSCLLAALASPAGEGAVPARTLPLRAVHVVLGPDPDDRTGPGRRIVRIGRETFHRSIAPHADSKSRYDRSSRPLRPVTGQF